MRILITTDVVGGVWVYTEELTDALLGRGHEVALVVLGGAGQDQLRWLEAHPELEWTSIGAPLEWMPEPQPALSASLAPLRAAVQRFRPDVIHLNQFFYGAHDLGAPKLLVHHSDVLSWWRAVRGEEVPDDAWFRRYRGWVREGLAGADVRAAPSGWMAATAEATYGVDSFHPVHCGRSPEIFLAASQAEREPLTVLAGRLWDEGKGARDLLGAARWLSGAGRVVVAGPAKHPAGGADFPTDAPGIEWAGILTPAELRSLFGRASVYAATSCYEPFGLAPLEAVLAGCALVMSDIPSFRELWDECALFYPAGDAEALSKALRELLDDGTRRATLAAAARDRALDRYTPERMTAGYEALYQLLA